MINKLKTIQISENNTIVNCMKILNKTGLKCLIVVDKNKKLIGSLTDGDIRRGILMDMSLSSKIKKIYNRKPLYLIKGKYSIIEVKKIFKETDVGLLPIINNKKIVVDYTNDIEAIGIERNIRLKKVISIIMAGGKGTRLLPYTQILPKPLVPINGKAIIEHIIEKFLSYGVNKFNLTVNYKSIILKSFFKELNPKYSVKFSEEAKPLGTAGGLNAYKNKIQEPFFITNCDVIINADYIDIYDFHKKNKNDITLVATSKNYNIPYGVCNLDKKGNFLSIKEKPKYNFLTNSGLYVLSPNILNLIPKNKIFQMTDLIAKAKKKEKKIGIYPIEEHCWIDIGEWSEYKKAIAMFS